MNALPLHLLFRLPNGSKPRTKYCVKHLFSKGSSLRLSCRFQIVMYS